MRTPSETAGYMLQATKGNAAKARELAHEYMIASRSPNAHAESERFWRDVLAALGHPDYVSK